MQHSGRVHNKPEHRMTFGGILYRMRIGCPWRDLPSDFGKWSAIFRRFNLWSRKVILLNLFNSLSNETDSEWLVIDGSIVRAHQHSTGARTKSDEAIGKSRGGNSTKIHLIVDSDGLPVHFELSGGQVHGIIYAKKRVNKSPKSSYVIADKDYDSEKFREHVKKKGAISVISRRKNRKKGNKDIDWCLYKYRHFVENAFGRIKNFRAIATRYDKLEQNYESMVALAFTIMWLPMHCD